MASTSENEPSEEEKKSIRTDQPPNKEANQVTPSKIPETEPGCKPVDNYYTKGDKNNRLQWWQLWVQIGLFVATTGAFIAAAYYAHIAEKQWKTMDDTFKEIKKQTGSAEKSAGAAESAAKTAENTFKLNKDNLLTEIKKQTKAMQDSSIYIRDTMKQSGKALDASIDIARTDQRAWIGTITVSPAQLKDTDNKPIYLKEGSPATFGVEIINSGKSPALNVTSTIAVSIRRNNVKFSDPHLTPWGVVSMRVIQPQGHDMLPTRPLTPPPTNSVIESIKSGENILYLFGVITYKDIFQRSHQNTFCFYLYPSLDTFGNCDTYNDAD